VAAAFRGGGAVMSEVGRSVRKMGRREKKRKEGERRAGKKRKGE
jgi:hypothetical protein